MSYPISAFEQTYWGSTNGDFYVSSTGNDEGDGSPSNPYLTVQKAINEANSPSVIVIGSGIYHEELNGLSKELTFIGDGFVTFDGQNTLGTGITGVEQTQSHIENITIKNYTVSAIASPVNRVSHCKIDGNITGFGGTIRYSVVCNGSIDATADTVLHSCTLVNVTSSTGIQFKEWKNCLFNSSTQLTANTASLENFNFCNHEPGAVLNINGTDYLSHLEVHTDNTLGDFQEDGQSEVINFVHEEVGNYALLSTNPLLLLGEYQQPIGALGSGISLHQSKGELTTGQLLLDNLEESTTGYSLVANAETGTITTRVIDMGTIKKMGRLTLFAQDFFEMIPSNLNHVLSIGHIHPRLLSFEMKFGESRFEVRNSDFKSMVAHRDIEIDQQGRGTAHLNFDRRSARKVATRYFQLQITLTSAQFMLVQENLYCLLQENNENLLWKLD